MKNLVFPAASLLRRLSTLFLLVASLSLFSATASRAQSPCRWAGVEKVSDMSYKVWACNPASKPGVVRITDSKGRIYYEQFSSAINFGGRVNVAGMDDGNYAILVKIGAEEHRFNLKLQSDSRRWADVSPKDDPAASRVASVQTSLPAQE